MEPQKDCHEQTNQENNQMTKQKFSQCPPTSITSRNRRYSKLKLLWEEGYFEEQELMLKYPQLYYDFVGKYKKSQGSTGFTSVSEFLQAQIVNSEYRTMVQNLQETNEQNVKSGIIQSGDEGMMEEQDQQNPFAQDLHDINREDLQMQEQAFIDFVEEQFLQGKLSGFNYPQIDNDEDLDDFKVMDQDEEEKYFNEESNEDGDPENNTGVQDF